MKRFVLPDWFCDWEEEGGTKIEIEQLLRGEFLPEDFHLTEEQFEWVRDNAVQVVQAMSGRTLEERRG